MSRDTSTLVLFDVDGTLTPSRERIAADVRAYVRWLRTRVCVGVVGGSDLAKQREQLGDDVLDAYDYVFSENGLVAHADGAELARCSLLAHFGEPRLQELINASLRLVADAVVPAKRGTHVELRTGMLNVSPCGRGVDAAERAAFAAYDAVHGVRAAIARELEARFPELACALGGQISIDVFVRGWDKRYCLRFVDAARHTTVHFFGDKTAPGGNDAELYADARVTGHAVASPADTLRQLVALFGAPPP